MDIEALKVEWLLEQQKISESVIAEKDTIPLTTEVESESSECGPSFSILGSLFQKDSSSQQLNNSYFGGVDVSFPDNEDQKAVAVYVILDARRSMEVVYRDFVYFHLTTPYIPSFLAFREIDPIMELINRQKLEHPEYEPSAILVDGNGIFHSRGAGIACFVGVRSGIPTIGVGKSLYCFGGLTKDLVWNSLNDALGKAEAYLDSMQIADSLDSPIRFNVPIYASEDEMQSVAHSTISEDKARKVASKCRGLAVPLAVRSAEDGNMQVLGCALVAHGRRKLSAPALEKFAGPGTKVPIFISIGHLISLQKAIEITAALSYSRIPEPVRQADLLGREFMRENGAAKQSINTNTT